MKNYRVTFQCKPLNDWRACSEYVKAPSAKSALAMVRTNGIGMAHRGPYKAEQIGSEEFHKHHSAA